MASLRAPITICTACTRLLLLRTRPSALALPGPFLNSSAIPLPSVPIRTFSSSQPRLSTPPPTDSQIPYRTVQLVSPETNTLGPPIPISSISYSRQTHTLLLVSPDPPVVKLIDKQERNLKERRTQAKAKVTRKRAMGVSEVQVSWESAKGDLERKVALARNVIQNGDRLELAFASKTPLNSSQAPAPLSPSKRQGILELFNAGLADVAQKWKEDELRRGGGVWIMHFQPTKEVRTGVVEKLDKEDEEKKGEKERRREERRKREEEKLKRGRAKLGADT